MLFAPCPLLFPEGKTFIVEFLTKKSKTPDFKLDLLFAPCPLLFYQTLGIPFHPTDQYLRSLKKVIRKLKINEMRIGERAMLGEFHVSPLHLHLLSMGISPGMQVKVVRRFPMKGNLYVQIGNRNLVMRDNEASQLEVTQTH